MFEAFPAWIASLKRTQVVVVIGEVSFDNLNLSFDGYDGMKGQMRCLR